MLSLYRFSKTAVSALLAAVFAAPLVAQADPVQRFFTVAAVEPKGGTTVAQEAFPDASLPAGGGYILKKVTLKADKAGVFPIECASHQPSMVGELIVLPRRQRSYNRARFSSA